MNPKKIVITGGPSTGKTSVIRILEERGYFCLHEISRTITLEARKEGFPQLFVSDPLLFSTRILEGRLAQFKMAETMPNRKIFFDRGLPDVIAYMDCFEQTYGEHFAKACASHRYDTIFLLPPWKEIHVFDNERYESYQEALRVHDCLQNSYEQLGYHLIEVPKLKVNERADFILEH